MDFIVAGLVVFVVYLLTRGQGGGGSDVAATDTGSGSGLSSVLSSLPDWVSSLPKVGPKATLQQWADAIFSFERGGGSSTSVAARNNNPGNIRDSSGQFIQFPSFADGMAALVADLQAKVRKYPDATLTQIMARYLGQTGPNGYPVVPVVTTEGNPFTYAQSVASKLGVSPGDTLRSIFTGGSNG